ncbi:MAG: ribosome small subunit-dependent GTPase A [Chlamydiia bacterium]|nr:ribosome small subunit-dependent GTPase A [Chlamydiia bacterium]
MPWSNEDYAEQFDPKGKRETRKIRKILQAKDRSKYKKTDSEKETPDPEINQAHKRGRVLSIKSDGIIVDLDGQPYICALRGSLKQEKTKVKNLVTVGDFVRVIPTDENTGSIVFVEKRYSHLSRAETLTQKREQLIAANIDQVLITSSVLLPTLKPTLVDRYIIAAKKGNMEPVILVNKIDLLDNPPAHIDARSIEEEKFIYDEFCRAYSTLGFPFIKISTVTGEGIDELRALMQDKTSVFSGQSGVGKSTLINTTLGTDLKTGDMVEKTRKGTHTTTSAQLIRLQQGGFCVDTPGIKSFGIWDIEPENVRLYFPDIHAIGHQCAYPNCSHMHEPGCAVHQALEEGRLSVLRFDSYSALMTSMEEKHKPR